MRILFISRYYPNNLKTCTYGTFQRMGMIIDAIKEIAQLDVLFYVPSDVDISVNAIAIKEQELSKHWNTKVTLSLCHFFSYSDSLSKWRRHWQGVFNFFKHRMFFGMSAPDQLAAFERCLDRKPDLIFVHRLGSMAPILLTSHPLPRICLDLDDIEHIQSIRSLMQLPNQLEPWLYGLQIPALFWGELKAINRADFTFVCSENDRYYLTKKWNLPGVVVVPNTVNIPEFQAIVEEPTLLFLASYQFEPNLHAANFLLEKIWPYIHQLKPNARLIIAGREPHRIRYYGNKISGVEFTGFVEDLDALYRKTRVVCCPILSGGGTRIKMIEAAAYGKPIVATTIGAEGLRMNDGKDFLLRDNPIDFAKACVELLNDSSLCHQIGKSAHIIAMHYYDRETKLDLIRDYISQLNTI